MSSKSRVIAITGASAGARALVLPADVADYKPVERAAAQIENEEVQISAS